MSARLPFLERVIDRVLSHRRAGLAILGGLTLVLAAYALRITVEAPHEKVVPRHHPFVQNYFRFSETFGGSNLVIIALMPKDGDIFTPSFLQTLERATQAVFLMPNVDRGSVRSLFSPAVRTLELVDEGFLGQNVVPAGFRGTAADIDQVRRNVRHSEEAMRLVAKDFRGAMVRAALLDVNPQTGQAPDALDMSRRFEALRRDLEKTGVTVHMIGYPMLVGEVADGLVVILAFFFIAVALSFGFVWTQLPSWKVSGLLVGSACLPVLWLLGLLRAMGFSMDPLSVLVPFLIFSIGLTHATQVGQAWAEAGRRGATPREAARAAFLATAAPGAAALLSDAFGFFVLLYVRVPMVDQIAWAAGVGVGLMVLCHFLLLPLVLSFFKAAVVPAPKNDRRLDPLWRWLARLTRPARAWAVVIAAAVCAALAWNKGRQLTVGDFGRGAPELRQSTRYNQDWEAISAAFAAGAMDYMIVYVEGKTVLDLDPEAFDRMDRFIGRMNEVPGVRLAMGISEIVKMVNALQNEGSLKWRSIPSDPAVLGSCVSLVPPEAKWMNGRGDQFQIALFLTDHHGDTLRRVVAAAREAGAALSTDKVRFHLAGGNAGILAASNEAVAKARPKVHFSIWAIVIISCLFAFRSLRGAVCVTIPLQFSSLLSSALMVLMGIGVRLATLPVVSLGVGVGEDYAMYLYHAYQLARRRGHTAEEAFLESFRRRGRPVMATAATMGMGLILWSFSPVKHQADLGLLLGFLFIANMLASLFLLPALVGILDRKRG